MRIKSWKTSGNEATINDKNKEQTKQIVRYFILFYHLFGGSRHK